MDCCVVKRGYLSIFYDKCSSYSKTTTEKIIEKIHNVVLNDRQVKVHEFTSIANRLLHENLYIKKLSVR